MTRVFQVFAALLATVVLSLGTVDLAKAEGYGKQKVVYHINYDGGPDSKAYKGAMRNIQNHINAVGAENLDLKVVLHGNGLAMLLDPAALKASKMKEANGDDVMTAKVASLKDQGVQFQICANTLKGRKVTLNDLYDASEGDVVPSGVAQLAILQSQGYAYIKP